MNVLSDISDEEFIPFLQNLGVDTFKKSFEWMLHDQDYAGVLRWLYENLDHNNALSAREEYRYAEIKKRGDLLYLTELEASIAQLQEEYEGLCLPGDKEAEEDVKFSIVKLNNRLLMLERQEGAINDLNRQNEMNRDELNKEVTKLQSLERQCSEDESSAADECLRLADDVESMMDDVVEIIADAFEQYSSSYSDKEISSNFFTFGPFESYRQMQALFRSHFDLFTSKKFGTHLKANAANKEIQSSLIEAKCIEKKLTDAIVKYVNSKAILAGEQAALAVVGNYSDVHPSQIDACIIETQSTLDILEQEECILEQQIQVAIKDFVESRTLLALETTAKAAVAVREQLHADITCLLENSQQAVALDRVLYGAMRRELKTLEELVQFAAHLKQYVTSEQEAICSRITSMNEICTEHCIREQNLESSDPLMAALCKILSVPYTNDVTVLLRVYNELVNNIRELKDGIAEGFSKKEGVSNEFKKSAQPLHSYVFDSFTKRPQCWDRAVVSLMYGLKQETDKTEKRILEASEQFTSVKNGDKHYMRRLWQWFVTDPTKLAAAMKGVRGKNYL